MKYIFRGIVVFKYDPATKSMENPETKHGLNSFNFCIFIPEDYLLLSEFFQKAYAHAVGALKAEELTDTEVY